MIKFRIVEVEFTESERLLTEDLSDSIMDSIYQNTYWLANYFKNYKPKEKLRKFRVDVQYPRSAKDQVYGHYHPGVLYVLAKSKGEAKQKAMEQLRSKLEPDETQDRRFKRNFLKDIEKVHVKPKASEVKSWKHFVEMIQHIASDRKQAPYPLLSLEDEDIEIFLNRMRKDLNFKKTLSEVFNEKEIKVIKTLYRHIGDNIDHMSKSIKDLYDPSVKKVLRDLKGTERPNQDKFVDPEWNYWSVYEPEDGDYDFSNLNTVKDVLNYAKRWGISKKDLDGLVKDKYSHEDYYYFELVKLYKYLRERLRVSPSNKAFEDDWASSYWKKNGIYWDQLALDVYDQTQFKPILGDYNIRGDDSEEKELIEWLWDFYKKGFPQRKPMVEKYKSVLEDMLEYRRKLKNRRKNDEDVPF